MALKNLSRRNGEFTVNIALIHQQAPVLGVVYVPASDELFYAAKGHGRISGKKRGCLPFAGAYF